MILKKYQKFIIILTKFKINLKIEANKIINLKNKKS